MSTRKTKSESETPSPAPRRRKTAAVDSSAPKTTRSRRKAAAAPEISEATDKSVAASLALTHEAIATRAYFIAVERGGPGDPVADWLLAEQQLRQL